MSHKHIRLSTLYFSLLIMLFSCQVKKEITYEVPYEEMEHELLDTLVISDVLNGANTEEKEFRPSATLLYDIINTTLNLSFDWNKQHVIGNAVITLKPYYKPISSVTFDAIGFDIHDIKITPSVQPASYQYDGKKLLVDLGKTYTSDQTLEISINYTAKPNENEVSGSEAITSDKGLFFINPLGLDPDSPTQIWTQGETENNSRWFPTFDKPNERFTQDIFLTVEDKYITLSNGKKMSTKQNNNGTRTDHWRQDKPCAAYLTMIAVGEFAQQTDTWRGIPLQYIVEKPFGPYAKQIFNHTPEMLDFFSNSLNYPYPWDKYAQIIVKDFVSGAMENTSAVVFGDFIQKTDRELIDNDNDYIIAHEMMHHWFGDLVTCEDWSNLTLNEGFANYAEYLWFEHKYGKDRAEYHRLNEMNGYFSQVFNDGAHPLINYFYEDKENMFDAHSYNKGGLVLHMLRKHLGDKAFFDGLNKYLKDNAYTAVEVDELRMAFEDTVGEDLNWFFNQWFKGSGHPHLDVTYTYHKENKVLLIEVDQSKTPAEYRPYFTFPVDIALYFTDGTVRYIPVMINEKNQRILIDDLNQEPVTYVFDGQNVLLALINENKTSEQYAAQFKFSDHLSDKINGFTNCEPTDLLISKALKDSFYLIRNMGIGAIADSLTENYITTLEDLAINDLHSEVRRDALIKLLNTENYQPNDICKKILDNEQAYPVIQIALEALGLIDINTAEPYIAKFKNENSDFLASTLVALMDTTSENLDYIENKAKNIGLYQIFEFYNRYNEFLTGKDIPVLDRSTTVLKNVASDQQGNMYRKYMATITLVKMTEDVASRALDQDNPENKQLLFKLKDAINTIVQGETNPILIEKYEGLK